MENGIDFRLRISAFHRSRNALTYARNAGGVIFVYSPHNAHSLEFLQKKTSELFEMRKHIPTLQCILVANESVVKCDVKDYFENWKSEGKKLAKRLQKYSGDGETTTSEILFYLQRAHAAVCTQTNIMQRIMAFVPHVPFFVTSFWMKKNTDEMCLKLATMIYQARRRYSNSRTTAPTTNTTSCCAVV